MFGTDNREEVAAPRTQTTRLTSSVLWDKGPITSYVCFVLVRTAAEKRKAKEDENARKRQAREDEMASKKREACVLASTLTTGLTGAEDVHKLTVEQLGAILLIRNKKSQNGRPQWLKPSYLVLGCHPRPIVHVAPMHHPPPMLAYLPPVCRPFLCCRIFPFLLFRGHSIRLHVRCPHHHHPRRCHCPSLCPFPIPTPIGLRMHWPACAPRPLWAACSGDVLPGGSRSHGCAESPP